MRASPEPGRPFPWLRLFARLVDLADALCAARRTKHSACWEHDLGGGLRVVANGHHLPKPRQVGEPVAPFTFPVLRQGALLLAVTPNCVHPADPDTELEVLSTLDRPLSPRLGG